MGKKEWVLFLSVVVILFVTYCADADDGMDDNNEEWWDPVNDEEPLDRRPKAKGGRLKNEPCLASVKMRFTLMTVEKRMTMMEEEIRKLKKELGTCLKRHFHLQG